MRLTARGSLLTWAGIVGATLLVAGCATSQAATLTTPTPANSADSMRPVALPAWAADTIDEPVPLATAQGADTSLAWQLVSTSDDGRDIQVIYVAGDGYCTTFAGFDVAETDTSVTLTATATTDTTQTACADMATDGAGTIRLAKPLGARQLIHPVVSPAWKNVLP